MNQSVSFTIDEFLERLNNPERFEVRKTESTTNGVTYTNRILVYTNDEGVKVVPAPLIKFKVHTFETKSYTEGNEPKCRLLMKLFDPDVDDDKVRKTLLMFEKLQAVIDTMALNPTITAHTVPILYQLEDKDGIKKPLNKIMMKIWPDYRKKAIINPDTGDKMFEKRLFSSISFVVPTTESVHNEVTGELEEVVKMQIDRSRTIPSSQLRPLELADVFKHGTTVACRITFKFFSDKKSKKSYLSPSMVGDMFITPGAEDIGITEQEALDFYN